MADPLSILGGLSASGQIISSIVKTVLAISAFCENFRNAPRHFVRIKDRLVEIQDMLVEIESQAQGLSEDDLLPQNSRELLQSAVATILEEVAEVQKHIPRRASITEKIQWAAFRKRISRKSLDELEQAEASLFKIIQFLTYISRNVMKLVIEGRRRDQDTRQERGKSGTSAANMLAIRRINFAVLNSDSIWRRLGVSGAFSYAEDGQGRWKSRWLLGLQPPWPWMRSVLFQLDLANHLDGTSGIRITSGHINLQHRIPTDHPFMMACCRGDIPLMRQCLDDQPSVIRDRCDTTGETPLLLAIRGESLEAVRWLLEQGANPNDGDDDQILPVFATLGMRAPRTSRFLQLAPKWNSWFECLRLLVSHKASVHEIVHGKTLGVLSVFSKYRSADTEDHTLDYINLLRSEYYVDFDTVDRQGWSILGTAFQSPSQGLRAMQILKGLGVNPSRILDDGRSYLSVALEATNDVGILHYLFDHGCAPHLNRQDKWGWTPLHYCIFAESGPNRDIELPKLRFLLEKGANTETKARHHHLIPIPGISEFTPIELADHLERRYPTGAGTMLRKYTCVEEIFYDAVAF